MKTLYTGICGSDNSATIGKVSFDWVQRPRVIGHEFSAEVLELGPGDHGDLKVGDIFTPLAMLGYQEEGCPACSVTKWNLCPKREIIGFHRNWGFGQQVVLEADRVVPLMKGLTPAQGALVEPLSIITNALYNKCNIKPGQDVADYRAMEEVVTNIDPTHIIHLGAYQSPDCSKYHIQGMEINTGGTMALFDIAEKLSNLQRFVFVSSAAVYGMRAMYPNPGITEDVQLAPPNHYGIWKLGG